MKSNTWVGWPSVLRTAYSNVLSYWGSSKKEISYICGYSNNCVCGRMKRKCVKACVKVYTERHDFRDPRLRDPRLRDSGFHATVVAAPPTAPLEHHYPLRFAGLSGSDCRQPFATTSSIGTPEPTSRCKIVNSGLGAAEMRVSHIDVFSEPNNLANAAFLMPPTRTCTMWKYK